VKVYTSTDVTFTIGGVTVRSIDTIERDVDANAGALLRAFRKRYNAWGLSSWSILRHWRPRFGGSARDRRRARRCLDALRRSL
jgi:hypothetical protein